MVFCPETSPQGVSQAHKLQTGVGRARRIPQADRGSSSGLKATLGHQDSPPARHRDCWGRSAPGSRGPRNKGLFRPKHGAAGCGLRAAWGLAVPPRPARYVCPGCPNRQHHALPVFLLWPVLFNRLTAMVLNTVQHVGVRNQVCPVASLREPPAATDPRPPTGVVSLADESPSDVN